jgi:starch-binding outer membrane protein, SusD/RagB family
MKYSFIQIAMGLAVIATLSLTACEKDFSNPGAATEDQVLASADGLTALAVGLQRRWSVGRQSPVYNM